MSICKLDIEESIIDLTLERLNIPHKRIDINTVVLDDAKVQVPVLTAIQKLSTDKAKQVFEKGKKNNWDLNKILTELQIPKEQKQLILDLNTTNREEIITDLLSNYSYTIEINTAKEEETVRRYNRNVEDALQIDRTNFTFQAKSYTSDGFNWFFEDGKLISKSLYEYALDGAALEAEDVRDAPTQEHKSLSARDFNDVSKYKEEDGWEYQELSINTPQIKNYKGSDHTPFTQFGGNYIGHVRVWYNKNTGAVEIQEIQSDLFQKSRDKQYIEKESADSSIYRDSNLNPDKFEISQPYKEEGNNIYVVKQNGKSQYSNSDLNEINKWVNKVKESINNFKDTTQNQFLQLLNKDNNWVTFFVKSIIQDSAKKGYDKVLFPSGNTASKVEGHTTLEEFKKQKEDRLQKINNDLDLLTNEYGLPEGQKYFYSDAEYIVFKDGKLIEHKFNPSNYQYIDVEINKDRLEAIKNFSGNKSLDRNAINKLNIPGALKVEKKQLEQELERVEKEGFGALKPIYNFYENTVTNILKKQKFNPTLITDEYGNTWNEITIEKSYPQEIIDLITDFSNGNITATQLSENKLFIKPSEEIINYEFNKIPISYESSINKTLGTPQIEVKKGEDVIASIKSYNRSGNLIEANINVDKNYQGQGIDTDLYLQLQANNPDKIVISSKRLTEENTVVWETLVREGNAAKLGQGSYILTTNINENIILNKLIDSILPVSIKEFYIGLTNEQQNKLGDIVEEYDNLEYPIEAEEFEDILKCKL